MNLDDQEWVEVFEAARRTAMGLCRDVFMADDLAAGAMERILRADAEVRPERLGAYASQVVRNLYRDEGRRQGRQPAIPMDGGEIPDSAEAIFGLVLHMKSPSVLAMMSERTRRQCQLAQRMLATLNPKQRRLLELSSIGVPSRDIAAELDYASAAVVDQTRSRLYRQLREEFEGQATTSIFGSVTGEW
jgi:RNA polymerase sigma factor (sigma-70 family)